MNTRKKKFEFHLTTIFDIYINVLCGSWPLCSHSSACLPQV